MSQRYRPDASAFERAQYMKAIQSFTPDFAGAFQVPGIFLSREIEGDQCRELLRAEQ
jgi:hypothetical protein